MNQPSGTHLAQFNWATLRYEVGDSRVAEFVDNIARMNVLAERCPGFVWRHLDDQKALKRLKHPGIFRRHRKFTTTLSVWTDLESLERFAFKTVHNRFYKKRGDWFETHSKPYMVMWFVPQTHRPSIPEAIERAEQLLGQGESAEAFGWAWAKANLVNPRLGLADFV